MGDGRDGGRMEEGREVGKEGGVTEGRKEGGGGILQVARASQSIAHRATSASLCPSPGPQRRKMEEEEPSFPFSRQKLIMSSNLHEVLEQREKRKVILFL